MESDRVIKAEKTILLMERDRFFDSYVVSIS